MNKYILSEGLNVLVRENDNQAWSFGLFDYEADGKYYIKNANEGFAQCIPYDRFPQLLGKIEKPGTGPYELHDVAMQRPEKGDIYYAISMKMLSMGAKVEILTWEGGAMDRDLLCEGLVFLNYIDAKRACEHINQAINRARTKKIARQRPEEGDSYYAISTKMLSIGAKVEILTWEGDAIDRYLLCKGLVFLNYSDAERACEHINQAINRARTKKPAQISSHEAYK